MIRTIIIAILIAISAYIGTRYETAKIKSTCEDEHAATILNGTAYVCLTTQQAQQIRQAITSSQHGA